MVYFHPKKADAVLIKFDNFISSEDPKVGDVNFYIFMARGSALPADRICENDWLNQQDVVFHDQPRNVQFRKLTNEKNQRSRAHEELK